MDTPVLVSLPALPTFPGLCDDTSFLCSWGVMGFIPQSMDFIFVMQTVENTHCKYVIAFYSKQSQERETLKMRQQSKFKEGWILHLHLEITLPQFDLQLKIYINFF